MSMSTCSRTYISGCCISSKVGLGNGKKRSRKYEDFVLTKRQTLKQEMGLCEHVTQKILGYSNNFLHKRLLTEKV